MAVTETAGKTRIGPLSDKKGHRDYRVAEKSQERESDVPHPLRCRDPRLVLLVFFLNFFLDAFLKELSLFVRYTSVPCLLFIEHS